MRWHFVPSQKTQQATWEICGLPRVTCKMKKKASQAISLKYLMTLVTCLSRSDFVSGEPVSRLSSWELQAYESCRVATCPLIYRTIPYLDTGLILLHSSVFFFNGKGQLMLEWASNWPLRHGCVAVVTIMRTNRIRCHPMHLPDTQVT